MKNILAVYNRELRAFFFSPLAYVLYVLFLGICSVFFLMYFNAYLGMSNEYIQMASMQPGMMQLPNYTEIVILGLTNVMTFVLLFIIPMLTMRLFAEEKKMGTLELIMTYPIKDSELLIGKYLAVLTVYAGMLALTLFYPIISYFVVDVWAGLPQTFFPTIFAAYFGVFLIGAAFLSFGLFASSLTENQIIAGLTSFAVLLVMWMIGFVDEIQPGFIGQICNEISVFSHFEQFSKGVIDTRHAAYYVLFSAFFLFFTLRVLDSNRWRG
ncbi:MAG: ABC transporter permease subunit [Candidatus Hinthialibacter antarcticus]|nr:ABC transporter permease subunit [Candidatus Hinthialibacter antarcticus]